MAAWQLYIGEASAKKMAGMPRLPQKRLQLSLHQANCLQQLLSEGVGSSLQESLEPKIKDLDMCKDWVSSCCKIYCLRARQRVLGGSVGIV